MEPALEVSELAPMVLDLEPTELALEVLALALGTLAPTAMEVPLLHLPTVLLPSQLMVRLDPS